MEEKGVQFPSGPQTYQETKTTKTTGTKKEAVWLLFRIKDYDAVILLRFVRRRQ